MSDVTINKVPDANGKITYVLKKTDGNQESYLTIYDYDKDGIDSHDGAVGSGSWTENEISRGLAGKYRETLPETTQKDSKKAAEKLPNADVSFANGTATFNSQTEFNMGSLFKAFRENRQSAAANPDNSILSGYPATAGFSPISAGMPSGMFANTFNPYSNPAQYSNIFNTVMGQFSSLLMSGTPEMVQFALPTIVQNVWTQLNNMFAGMAPASNPAAPPAGDATAPATTGAPSTDGFSLLDPPDERSDAERLNDLKADAKALNIEVKEEDTIETLEAKINERNEQIEAESDALAQREKTLRAQNRISEIEGTTYHDGEEVYLDPNGSGHTFKKYKNESGNTVVERYDEQMQLRSTRETLPKGGFNDTYFSKIPGTKHHKGEKVYTDANGYVTKAYEQDGATIREGYKNGELVTAVKETEDKKVQTSYKEGKPQVTTVYYESGKQVNIGYANGKPVKQTTILPDGTKKTSIIDNSQKVVAKPQTQEQIDAVERKTRKAAEKVNGGMPELTGANTSKVADKEQLQSELQRLKDARAITPGYGKALIDERISKIEKDLEMA